MGGLSHGAAFSNFLGKILHVQNSGSLLTVGRIDAFAACTYRCVDLSSKCLINRINYTLFQTFYLTNEVIAPFFFLQMCSFPLLNYSCVLFLIKLH